MCFLSFMGDEMHFSHFWLSLITNPQFLVYCLRLHIRHGVHSTSRLEYWLMPQPDHFLFYVPQT